LINLLDENDKLEVEKHAKKINEIRNKLNEPSRRNIKLTWGGKYSGFPNNLNVSNLLTYIDADKREALHLTEADKIGSGDLTYCGHNLNDKSRAYVYSILLRYISILSQKYIKLCKY
jgi:hypothetical protein